MRLENIIRNAGVIGVRGNRGLEITDICNDSREVTPGAIFIAVKGYAQDGHAFIGKASLPVRRPSPTRTRKPCPKRFLNMTAQLWRVLLSSRWPTPVMPWR